MKRCALVLAALGVVVGGAPAAHADSIITFTETATASGILDGTAFSNALVTLSATANTATITKFPFIGLFEIFPPEFKVSVSGVSSDTIAGGSVLTNIFSNQSVGGAGFFDGIDILDTLNVAFGTYALSTAIGPVSGPPIITASFPFPTGLGVFEITSVSGDATFTAAVATPEPSSMFMLGTGLLGVLGIWKRQR